MTKAHTLWYAVGTEFARAVGVFVLMASTGILNAPNKEAAVALSWAALFGALAAGLRAIQIFVPQISWKSLTRNATIGAWLDAFSRAALSSFLVTITGWLAAPDYGTWRSVALAAVTGALLAGARALQGLLTPTEDPAPDTGISGPKPA